MIRNSLTSFAVLAGLAAVTATGWALTTPLNDWKIAGPFGGTATTVAIDPESPKTLLAGGLDTLLFESQDFGANWLPLNFPKRNLGEVTTILVDPGDSSHYLVGVLDAFGGGLYESRDYGKSWDTAKDIKDFAVRALTFAPSNPAEFIAGTVRGVMLSADSGKTWTRISDPNNLEMQGITSVAVDPKDPNTIYAGTSHLPWKTTDAGKTWESIHSGMIDDSDVFSIYVDPSQPSDVFASACSGIYASVDRGDSWRKIAGIPNTSRRTHVIRLDPTESSTIYAGTTTGLFKSPNGGTIWKPLTNTQVNSIAFDPAQPKNMYLAMEYEGVAKSDDGGQTIKPLSNGFVDRQIGAVTTLGNKLVAIESQNAESTGMFISPDKGETWSQIRNMRGLGGVHLRTVAGSSTNDRMLLGATSHQVFKSVDGGMVWKPLAIKVIVKPPTEEAKPVVPVKGARRPVTRTARARRPVKPRVVIHEVIPQEISGLYAVRNGTTDLLFLATNVGLFKSADMGEQWTETGLDASGAVSGLYTPPTSDGRLVARTSLGLYSSKDYGEKWDRMSFPLPSSDVNEIAIPGDPSARLLAATRVGLYSSTDGGGNWYAGAPGIAVSTVASVVYSGTERTGYAVEYGQLYQTNDGGNSWTVSPTTLPSLQIRQLWTPDTASTRLYAITSGMGILFRN
ncbi:MAG: YCF48-related protein [Acidobacteriota bacterium]|nr:YCF48-related protein [Acidobacteriota bacterium]